MGLVQVTLTPLVIAFHSLLSSPCISNTVRVIVLFKVFYFYSALNLLSSLIHQSVRSIANLCFLILWLFLYCTISSIQVTSCLSIRFICCCLGRFFTLESPLFLGYISNTIDDLFLFKLFYLYSQTSTMSKSVSHRAVCLLYSS